MKLLQITGFLPDTSNTLEHASVVSMKELVDDVAQANGTTVRFFDVSKGVAVVGLEDDSKLGQLATQFEGMPDVKTSEISKATYLRAQNKAAQERINKMRKAREEKKKG